MFHLIATEFRRNGAVRQEALDFLDETLDLDGWNGAEHRAIIAPRLAFLLHVAREWVESRESKLFEDEGPDNLGQKTAELALKWGRPNRWLLERHRRAVLRAVRAGSENALDHALVALLWEVPGYSIEETLRALVPMARRLCRTRANVWPDFSCVMRSQSTSIEGLCSGRRLLRTGRSRGKPSRDLDGGLKSNP